jgi:hypothetical protein
MTQDQLTEAHQIFVASYLLAMIESGHITHQALQERCTINGHVLNDARNMLFVASPAYWNEVLRRALPDLSAHMRADHAKQKENKAILLSLLNKHKGLGEYLAREVCVSEGTIVSLAAGSLLVGDSTWDRIQVALEAKFAR